VSQLYTLPALPSITWPEPIETAYQMQTPEAPRVPGARRPDITAPARLLIASVVQLAEARSHGAITWLADVFRTSRQTIYAIGERAVAGPIEAATGEPAQVESSPHRLERAALTLLVPGGTSLRPTLACLDELLGQARSVGWLAELVDEAGARAGAALERADFSACRPMIAARDELYFDGLAHLLTLDTQSLAIVGGHVETNVDADTWGVALALAEERTGGRIVALAEDGARYFPRSIDAACRLLDAPWGPTVQKDLWHLLDHVGQAVVDAERSALAALERAEAKARSVAPGFWVLADPTDDGVKEHAQAEARIQEADTIRTAAGLLRAGTALVDARTDRILERQTAEWAMEVVVEGLRRSGGRPGRALAGTIARQREELLTFHDWLELDLAPWRARAEAHFDEAELVELFERAVARVWRLEREATNGHPSPSALRRARVRLRSLCQNDPEADALAEALHALLERVVRTSSAVECINSLLRAYLWARRTFKNRRTAQRWLNLFVLWHNMRRFQRGKREGQSPFELAGVRVTDPDGNETDDWLAAMGYPAAA